MELGEGQVSLFSDQHRQIVFALYNCRKDQNGFFLNSCNVIEEINLSVDL